jgi:hypothetical protein
MNKEGYDGQTMFRLSNLSIDALQGIFAHLKARHIVRMWIVGDKSMQFIMSERGAVQEFHISENHREVRVVSSIIPLLSRLQRFSFKASSRQVFFRSEDVCTLPGSITDLKIESYDNFQSAMRSHPTLPLFSNLRRLELDAYAEVPSEQTWPAGITDLTITTRPFDLILSHLPLHLTALAATIRSLEHSQDETFPCSLTSLSLRYLRGAGDIALLLPYGLLRFKLHCSYVNHATLLSSIPPHLTSLDTDSSCFVPFYNSPSYFPPSLTSLAVKLVAKFPVMLHKLPPTLTRLTGVLKGNFDEVSFKYFPSLRVLYSDTLVPLSYLSYLPSTLTQLGLDAPIPPKYEITAAELARFASLPIERLHLAHKSTLPLLSRPLPPKIRALLINFPLTDRLTLEQIKNLPPRLERLQLFSCHFVSGDCLNHLPQTLVTLRAYFLGKIVDDEYVLPIFEEGPTRLSPWLTSLQLGPIATKDAFWISHLPNSIIKLKLDITKIKETWNNMDHHITSSTTTMISLPRYLRKLNILFSSNPHFGLLPFIRALPSTIKHVYLRFIPPPKLRLSKEDSGLTNDHIAAYLPPLIKSLTLPPSIGITAGFKGRLPTWLKILVIGGTTPEWFCAGKTVSLIE